MKGSETMAKKPKPSGWQPGLLDGPTPTIEELEESHKNMQEIFPNSAPDVQQAPQTCHTITDLFHPEEQNDSKTPLSFSNWQVVGKF